MNEVTEGVSSQHEMVQYHALSLLYQIKAHDRLAVSKLVSFSSIRADKMRVDRPLPQKTEKSMRL